MDQPYRPPCGYFLVSVVGDDKLHLIETASLRIKDHTYVAPCGFASPWENAGAAARVVAVRFLAAADPEEVCLQCLQTRCRTEPKRKRRPRIRKNSHS
jgi:hypothetical protein